MIISQIQSKEFFFCCLIVDWEENSAVVVQCCTYVYHSAWAGDYNNKHHNMKSPDPSFIKNTDWIRVMFGVPISKN